MSFKACSLLLLALLVLQNVGTSETKQKFDFVQWLDELTQEVTSAVHPGMTRKQLMVRFTAEGGLSNRLHRQYVYRKYRSVKIAVDFAPVGNVNDNLKESPEDKIIRVSKPFLEQPICD